MRFKDKSVIITGGGGKIAKAYATAFAKEGAKLSLPDIASADQIGKAIRDMGGAAISMACDVSNDQSVKKMVEETVRQFGTVDILINNAAYFMTVWKGPFWEMTVDEFDKAMAVNVRGAWLCAKAVVPHMQKQKKGKIVQYLLQRGAHRQSQLQSLCYIEGRDHRDDAGDGARVGRLEYLRQHGEPRLRRHRRPQSRPGIRKGPRAATKSQTFPGGERPGGNGALSMVVRERLYDWAVAERRRWFSLRGLILRSKGAHPRSIIHPQRLFSGKVWFVA